MGQSISQKKPLILPDLSVFHPFLILVTKTGKSEHTNYSIVKKAFRGGRNDVMMLSQSLQISSRTMGSEDLCSAAKKK
jgi:hypothetical protein